MSYWAAMPDRTRTDENLPIDHATFSALMRVIGRRGGLKGGPARAASMSAKQRKESARKAARARWKK
jgi:hypothetical protein